MNLQAVQAQYPRSGKNRATTGRIPMVVFEANEVEFRAMMRAEKLQVFYRGPRVSNNTSYPSTTRRCDAVAVLLYRK